MKTKIIILSMLIALTAFGQSNYELVPGSKGNEIVLQLANLSQSESAENLEIKLVKSSQHLEFTKSEDHIPQIGSSTEKEVSFLFNVLYNTSINVEDTIVFLVTDSKGIFVNKVFIFNYTAPKDYSLEQNFPNPFNPSTKIRYTVPDLGDNPQVMLRIYDILGNEVETLVNEKQAPGYKEIDFNGRGLASGVYIYRLSASDFVSIKKMTLIK